jgi:hypothetical protein
MTEDKKKGLDLRGGEIVFSAVVLAICAAAWLDTGTFVNRVALIQTLSPALFPRILIAGLAASTALLLARAVIAPENRPLTWGHMGRVTAAAAVMFAQAFLFDQVGALPTACVGVAALLWIAGINWRMTILLATGFLAFVYLFFIVLLRVQLPMEFFPT